MPPVWKAALERCVNGTFWAKTYCALPARPCSWAFQAQSVVLPWKVSSPKQGWEEWQWVGVFLFGSRVGVMWIRIGQGWNNNNKALQGCFQAKIVALRQRSLSNSSHGLYAWLPSHPAHQTYRVCVPEEGFDLSQTTRLHHHCRAPQSNIRLGRFLESVQHVQARLIQLDDYGEKGLALLSFHVITSHIRIMAPVDELWLNSFNSDPLGCCRDSEW